MRIELKNIKYAAFASEETSCFQATVYLDGVKSITVSNEGHGGSNEYHDLVPGATDALIAYAKTLPQTECYGSMLDMDIDILIGDILEAHLNEKHLIQHTKKLLKKVAITKKGVAGIFTFKMPYDKAKVDALRASRTDIDKVLNELPFEEALALVKADNDRIIKEQNAETKAAKSVG